MTTRFRTLFCGACHRSVPRAAMSCLWCARPLASSAEGHTPEGEAPDLVAGNDDAAPQASGTASRLRQP